MDYPDYLQRNFPETTKILFRGEIVDWVSPDGHYAIRKTFSNALNLTDSKVTHAELIEKSSGEALCDLTADDMGAGLEREGHVLWAPDSKCFAYVNAAVLSALPDDGDSIGKVGSAFPLRFNNAFALSGAAIVLPVNMCDGNEHRHKQSQRKIAARVHSWRHCVIH